MDVAPALGLPVDSVELSLLGVLGEEDIFLLSSLDEDDATSVSDTVDLGDACRKRKKTLTSMERRYVKCGFYSSLS